MRVNLSNLGVVVTIVSFIIAQSVAGVVGLLHATREYDNEVKRVDILYIQVATIKDDYMKEIEQLRAALYKIEENTKGMSVFKEREDNNSRAIERLNDTLHPPTP